ncbi:hypothetical protein Pcinc_033698 [Petrolisthes cinctipes]|uniref:Uncharacterized protein n=1 Tax=Petrolisthes cinctipes TaxID=88211 RepID=A0AAE1K0V4_PETCI|nr:hypothetical protein Pcinc_033698 [Petrolisthes cinctipes]
MSHNHTSPYDMSGLGEQAVVAYLPSDRTIPSILDVMRAEFSAFELCVKYRLWKRSLVTTIAFSLSPSPTLTSLPSPRFNRTIPAGVPPLSLVRIG